ncbi:MAG: hypothetical protein H6551_03915 [Chitinophagales bacterium]|nr:hypothetical protein [Chitinophagaceae bacterium]MCB9064270.1 hypothetical protein [Chitinophagales bacterium]
MKNLCNKLAIVALILIAISFKVNAGGPGFDKDVYTWGNDSDDDSNSTDDDSYNGGGGYGGGGYGGYDDDDDNWNNDDDCNDIPLDGGMSFLAMAGVAYGIKRIADNKAKNKEQDK